MTGALWNLLPGLHPHFRVDVVAFAPRSGTRRLSMTRSGVPVTIMPGAGARMILPPAWLHARFQRDPPTAVLVHAPLFAASAVLEALQPYRHDCPIAIYAPFEGEPTAPSIVPRLSKTDLCILYTRAARDAVARLHQIHPSNDAPPLLRVLGHGVDHTHFRPLHADEHLRRRMARRARLPERLETPDAFVVLNVNRDYGRKRLDLTIEGFSRFAITRPDAFLVLHTGARTQTSDQHLQSLLRAGGVGDRIFLSPEDPGEAPLSLSALNQLYNAADVGLTTAEGEGWGLTACEHAATGAAQIVPGHAGFREIWGSAAIHLPCGPVQDRPFELSRMSAPHVEGVSQALADLHDAPAQRRRWASLAHDHIRQPSFGWNSLGATLCDHLREIIHAHATTARRPSLGRGAGSV
ncbi:hypothetical protein V7S57_01760 [Caulobacter sp. CCNWLY153]|uniref:hypothetical protein n=1 Tax=unclassified Caulobacter TaxID=2648921 RepID=UPI002FF3C5C4